VTAGDHDIFIGEMVSAHATEGEPLIHYASRYRSLSQM
jgi:flavin reductase (DIM6/NTAB) family NADH-FMN oxidoreductase RutF